MLLFRKGSWILIRSICSLCDVQRFDIPLFLLRLYLQNRLNNVLVILIGLCLKLNRFRHRSLWNNLLHAAVWSHLLLFFALFGILVRLWLLVLLLLIALHLPIIDFLILRVVQIFRILILLIFIRFLLVLIFLTDILLLFILAFLILNHQIICWLFDLYHRLWFLSILILLILHLIWHKYLASSALFLFLLLPTLLVYVLTFIVIFLRVPVTKTHFLLSGILDTLFFFLFRLLKASWVRVQVSVATRILLR